MTTILIVISIVINIVCFLVIWDKSSYERFLFKRYDEEEQKALHLSEKLAEVQAHNTMYKAKVDELKEHINDLEWKIAVLMSDIDE